MSERIRGPSNAHREQEAIPRAEMAAAENIATPESKRLEELEQIFSLDKYVFFLGGMDAEMRGIQRILEKEGVKYQSKGLSWGAKAIDYDDEIEKCRKDGYVSVLIELEGAHELSDVVVIDHHGMHAGREASIMQVMFEMLYRKEILLGVNDAEYIGGLIQKGATKEEIDTIREMDRLAQGITEDQEQEAIRAIAAMERFPEMQDLILVRMGHSRTATVADRLFMDQHGRHGQNMLIVSSENAEVNYLGVYPDLCKLLQAKFGGWTGGKGLEDSSSRNAYWGVNREANAVMPAQQEEIVIFVKNYFTLHEPQMESSA